MSIDERKFLDKIYAFISDQTPNFLSSLSTAWGGGGGARSQTAWSFTWYIKVKSLPSNTERNPQKKIPSIHQTAVHKLVLKSTWKSTLFCLILIKKICEELKKNGDIADLASPNLLESKTSSIQEKSSYV